MRQKVGEQSQEAETFKERITSRNRDKKLIGGKDGGTYLWLEAATASK
jgi:hypothetical protein